VVESNSSKETMQGRDEYMDVLRRFSSIAEANNIRWYAAYGTALGAVRHGGFIPWDDDVDVIVPISDYPRMLDAMRHGFDGSQYVVHSASWDPDYDRMFARIIVDEKRGLHFDIWPLVGAPKGKIRQYLFTKATYATRFAFYAKKIESSKVFKDNPRKCRQFRVIKVALAMVPARTFAWMHKRLEKLIPFESASFVRVCCALRVQGKTFPHAWFKRPMIVPFEDFFIPVPTDVNAYLSVTYGNYLVPRQNAKH